MFKKIISLICVLAMILTFAGCTDNNKPTNVNPNSSSADNSTSQETSSDDTPSDNSSSGNSSIKDNSSYTDYEPGGNDGWTSSDSSSNTTTPPAPTSIFSNDYPTTKKTVIIERGKISSVANTLTYENLSVDAGWQGINFRNEAKANIVSDFQKSGDKMVHVSTFVIIDGKAYMTYYANTQNEKEDPTKQKARFVVAPTNDLNNKKYYDIMSAGDFIDGKLVRAIYDTVLMYKGGKLYIMWAALIGNNYYRLYQTYNIKTEKFGEIQVNKFKVGNIVNDFSVSGVKSALAENEIPHKELRSDIGIMQKLSTRVENGVTYYYTGAYCGYFNCIVKSKDLITWEYVATPDFINESEYENATYVIGDKVYYFVRQESVKSTSYKGESTVNYGFLTCYDLKTKKWSKPVLITDCQSRSDLILYNNELYLIHAAYDYRTGVGFVKIDQDNLANSQVLFRSNDFGGMEYPFIQYAYKSNGTFDTSYIYLSYTTSNRAAMRLLKFNPANYFK